MKAAIVTTLVSSLLWATTTSADNSDNIHFDKNLIPHLNTTFPIYKLDSPTLFPTDKFDEILRSTAPEKYLNRTYTDNGYLVYDGERLIGFVDKLTGESTIFAQFAALIPAESIPTRGIFDFLSNKTIFPSDDTTFNPLNGTTLTGTTKNGTTSDATPPLAYLKDIFVDRIITHDNRPFPSCGEGNKGYFSFGADGKIHSLTHRWQAAHTSTDSKVAPLPTEKIYNSIKDQLRVLGGNSSITVDLVDVCFFESGARYLQPVYRFYATVEDGNPDTLAQHVVGYVAVGDSPPEPVPSFQPLDGQVLPGYNNTGPSRRSSSSGILNKRAKTINVGRYVAQNDKTLAPRWVEDANYFWNGLRKNSNNFNLVNSQYYWAEPFVYTSDKDRFVNNVDLAYTVGHGSPHTIYTNSLLAGLGPVDLSSQVGGYGSNSNGGGVRYWIIKGCNVTLSPDDTPSFNAAFDPWWSVFNGIHSIMSYRTFSWSSDSGEGNDVGSAIANGAGVLQAWMKGVNQHNNGGREKASAVTVCGHADDTLWQTGNIGRPGCLQIWWYK